jgi:putative toxin-antitoxin system antitoxin component (TIGR02293 family)
MSRDQKDKILRLGAVYALAIEVLESPENALAWLRTPNYAFQCERPLDHIFSHGKSVKEELHRIQHGIFI